MKILIYSPAFYPSIGGLETAVSILAHEFVAQGHQVKLVSQTPNILPDIYPFEVIRLPNPFRLLRLIRWCDIYFQPNISLKGIWPLFLSPKPWVVSHNGWYTRSDGKLAWQDRLKHFMIRFSVGISVSQAVADHISSPSIVIPNPYEKTLFVEIPSAKRTKELVFLGRLVSDKGVDLLLQTLADLKERGLQPCLTIIGSGPEEVNLRHQVDILGIINQVEFVGAKTGQELVKFLNSHQILVVPSCWQEPFGIVALEGIACGCVVVGSEGGGLKEAIGPCGATFSNKDVNALTNLLEHLLRNPDYISKYKSFAAAHLARHQPTEIAKAYLKVMEKTLQ